MRRSLQGLSLLGLIICVLALTAALLIEQQYLLSPCPLCTLQRLVFIVLAATFSVGTIFKLKSFWRYVYSLVILILSATGFGIAAYQFWLQYFAPPQQMSCSASLRRLIEVHPMLDALKMAFHGSSECATIDFTILTISVAGWSLILFGAFIILTLYALYLQKKRRI